MTPAFQLTALVKSPDGKTTVEKNITARILPHLISLTLTDNAGEQADTLKLVLADTARATVIPEPDTILSPSLGYKGGTLREMGSYAVTEVNWSDPPSKLTLTARSVVNSDEGTPADFPAMQDKKTRSWEAGTRLADMAAKIAEEHNLKPAVGASLQSIVLPHTDQTSETNISFLNRLVNARGGWVKVVREKLVIVTAADAKLAAGKALPADAPPPISISPGQYTSLDWKTKKRWKFSRVTATYHDIDAAADREIAVGDPNPKAPTNSIRDPFTDEQSATAAARALLEQTAREGASLNVTLPAPPDMAPSADAPVTIKGISPRIDGQWMPKIVTWSLSRSGLSVSIACETEEKS